MSYSAHDLSDTIVALATPAGVGAIGVIRLSGIDAITIANKAFPSKDLLVAASHTVHFGTIRNAQNDIIDEVLMTLFKAPSSYTRENVVEVSCHGSPYIIQQIIQLFIEQGARMAKAGEFTMRAFLNGQMDLSQAEAVADLIASSSASSHEIAMAQMRGGFSDKIKKLREELVRFASLIELELDFGEEDVEFANRDDLKKLVLDIHHFINDLLQSFALGNVIKNGVSTVIAGRPNAGKSTLLNALLNEDRAIVSHIAGTTRDTIEEVLNIQGIQFRLIDTAGIRDAQDTIEAVGVEKTYEKIKSSAILVYVFDVGEMTEQEVLEDVGKLQQPGLPTLLIINKLDTISAKPNFTKLDDYTPLYISAANKENTDAVKAALYDMVLSQKVKTGDTIVSNTRHFEALKNASDSLEKVLDSMATGITSDFIAMDIRQSLHHLGEIVGVVSTDDLLERIFSDFCIGK